MNKMNLRIAVKAASLTAMALLAAASMAAKLNVGDKAPKLAPAKWAKGTEVTNFEKGKVYVVEFWATWCGPCKVSIPHITEMAKQFKGKVTFVGVSVWEDPKATDNSYFTKVDKFVADMGDKMDYNVAMDGFEGTMASSWMEAAGENGIPSAFVIDQEGTIAWIGHPMDGLDKVLPQVIAKKWDKAKFAKERAAKMMMEEQMGEISTLLQNGEVDAALDKIDEIIKAHPDMAAQLADVKFQILISTDEPKAYVYAKEFADKAGKDDFMTLNTMAWTIVDPESELEHPDYKLALAIAEKANKFSGGKDPAIMDTLAWASFKNGDKARAVKLETEAIEILKKNHAGAEEVKQYEDSLAVFKKG